MTHTERKRTATTTAMPRPRTIAFAIGALLLAAVVPSTSHAQFGASIGFRSMNSEESFIENSDRRGFDARATYDRALTPVFGLRAEVAFVQMQFDRDDGSQVFQVSENGFEVLPTLILSAPRGALTGFYATIAPVASFRAVCGSSGRFSSNGRVACEESETYRTGYSAGVGFQRPLSRNRNLMVEVRYMGGTVAASGNELLALSVGLRARD